MLRAAIADPDPVVIIEARGLYQVKGPVALGAPVEAAAGARLRREGADVLVVTWGTMVAAGDGGRRRGSPTPASKPRCSICAGSIRSTTTRCSGRSRQRTGACSWSTRRTSPAASAPRSPRVIQERHFDDLDHPVVRLGVPDSRIPSAPALQRALLPDVAAIERVAAALAAGEAVAVAR